MPGLILGRSATDASSLNFGVNQATPELAIGGTLATSGSVAINIAGVPAPGSYVLATYGSLQGAGSSAFALGSYTLTSREHQSLTITTSAIDWVITGVSPTWTGSNNSLWVGGSNWKLPGGAATDFLPLDAVTFDDSVGTSGAGGGPGSTAVTISGSNVNPGSVTFNNTVYPYTVSGTYGIVGSGNLTVSGSGHVTLATPNSYLGSTIISAGTLQIGNGGAAGTLGAGPVSNNGVLAFGRSDNGLVVANTIGGSGSVLQLGPGMTTLTATNNYSGGTVINGGTLSIAGDANLGTVPLAATPAAISLNNAVLQVTGVGAVAIGATSSYVPVINANRGITLGASGGTINVAAVGSGNFNVNESGVLYAGVISGSGNLTISGGSGTNSGAAPYLLELGAAATYSGNTTISNATVSFLNNGNTFDINALPATSVLNLVNNGMFVLNNGNASQTVAGLRGDASGMVASSNGGATVVLAIVPSAGQSYTFPGTIGGATVLGKVGSNATLSLSMSGAGTQILSGANTYANGTTIYSGTLVAANSNNGSALGSGTVGINSGGVLASDPTVGGTIGGNVTANAGATLAPGGLGPSSSSLLTGALNIGGGLSLASGSTLNFDLNASTADPLNVTGLMTGSGINLSFNTLAPLAASSYTLATFNAGSGLIPGDFNYTPINGYTLTVGGSNLTLVALSGAAIWQGSVSTSWTNASNWNSSVPNSQGAVALVGSATATPTTITLDGPVTLGQLTLSATNAAAGYTLAAGNAGALVMSNTNSTAVILIPSGSHSITAAVSLAGALSIQPSSGMTLNIVGNISEMTLGGGSLSLDAPGTLILGGSDNYTGGTTLTAGTLIATSSSSLAAGTNLTVGAGSTFIFDPSVAAAPAAGGGARFAAAPANAVAAVPEPGTLALLGVAAVVAAAAWRRRKKA